MESEIQEDIGDLGFISGTYWRLEKWDGKTVSII